jgi:FkbM family methyltransferase
VAVEPQGTCLALLQRWYGRTPGVTLVGEAVGAATGRQTLRISHAHPTVTTLSGEWIDAVSASEGFAHVQWEGAETVAVTTLDALIAAHGVPAFCKLDIEGYEAQALNGLSQPLPALSFEFVPAAKDEALACLARLEELGAYTYNWSLGEQHRWQAPAWLQYAGLAAYLQSLPPDGPSGDIYARLLHAQPSRTAGTGALAGSGQGRTT